MSEDPNDISFHTDAQIRQTVLRLLERERAGYARQAADSERAAKRGACDPRERQMSPQAAEWAAVSHRYVAEFDRAIAAVKREFGQDCDAG